MKTLNNSLIIISSTLPYSFPTDYIKQTAEILSKKNKVIIFLWGEALSLKEIVFKLIFKKKGFNIIKKDRQVILFIPIHFIPFRRFEIIQEINLFINSFFLKIYLKFKKKNRLKKILWIFNYTFYNLPLYFGKSYLSLYDCVDFFSSLDKKIDDQIKTKQKKLVKNVDLFFVNSQTLKERFKKYSPILLPQGFALELFKKSINKPIDNKLKKILNKRLLLGLIGGINYRIDFKLINQLAKKHPEWNFVFVGQIQKHALEDKYYKTFYYLNKLLKLKNITHISNQSKSSLPKIISCFNICLIPYNINIEFNRYCHPMKVFEYFYMGKPVIATPIEELKRFLKIIKIAKNPLEFENHIINILKSGWPKKYQQEQRKLAITNSWQTKIEKISQILKKEFPVEF